MAINGSWPLKASFVQSKFCSKQVPLYEEQVLGTSQETENVSFSWQSFTVYARWLNQVYKNVPLYNTSCSRWHFCCYVHLKLWLALEFSSWVVKRSLSHMCGRLSFPMFLLRVGLFILMQMDSFMVLASLPTMFKSSTAVMWHVLFWWSYMVDGFFKCSLNLSPKVLANSPMYSASYSTLLHLYWYITQFLVWCFCP